MNSALRAPAVGQRIQLEHLLLIQLVSIGAVAGTVQTQTASTALDRAIRIDSMSILKACGSFAPKVLRIGAPNAIIRPG
jgi:hypothetical protein